MLLYNNTPTICSKWWGLHAFSTSFIDVAKSSLTEGPGGLYSRTNGVTIHLFQVMNPKEYTYSGLVKLAGDPYTETGPEGLVWVFPIQPNQGSEVKKPAGLEFSDMEDFQKRGEQSILHFIRRRDNYIGYRVRHTEHGLGTVNSFDGTLITVSFDNNQTKTYHFNKSIQGGYLTFAA